MSRYNLIDIEENAKAHPETFEIPPRKDRESVRVGDLVKLTFSGPAFAERMWVEVRGVRASKVFRGVLRNRPVGMPEIKGSIFFGPNHVLDIDSTERLARS
jgi:hypothetical protein